MNSWVNCNNFYNGHDIAIFWEPSDGECIKKMWCLYTTEYDQPPWNEGFILFATTWIKLVGIIPSSWERKRHRQDNFTHCEVWRNNAKQQKAKPKLTWYSREIVFGAKDIKIQWTVMEYCELLDPVVVT